MERQEIVIDGEGEVGMRFLFQWGWIIAYPSESNGSINIVLFAFQMSNALLPLVEIFGIPTGIVKMCAYPELVKLAGVAAFDTSWEVTLEGKTYEDSWDLFEKQIMQPLERVSLWSDTTPNQ